ncbi:DNA-binding response regulator [Spirochaetia bacterium]|nr:DNA-binding response regulator [Spirochaetia bacterium]
MIEIALCDDDPAITGFLESTLKGFGYLLPEPMHIQVFHQGAAILETLKNEAGDTGVPPFDIIFLDIELGDTTGIVVAEQIRKQYKSPTLIFVSAHESYCKQLFHLDTTAFLSKPIDETEVKSLLLRIYRHLRNPQQVFMYHIKEDVFRTPLEDILFFETKLRKIEMTTKQGTVTFYGKLGEIEARLKHPGFIRIHHSLIVNLDNVERFEKNTLAFPGGLSLALARNRQKEIRRKIMDYYTGTSGGAFL